MRFTVEETEYKDGYFVIDTHHYDQQVDEFESKYDAEILCEILNDTYLEGIEDGKGQVLNGEI